MNLTDDKTWNVVRGWLIGLCCALVYFVGFGLTAGFYRSRISLERIEDADHFLAAMFWPVSLPGGLALWHPLPTLGVSVALIGGVTLAVLRLRRRQLQDAETERVLHEAGVD